MHLLSLPIPPCPEFFSAHGAPPGIAVDFNAFKDSNGNPWWKTRPIIRATTDVVHTNAAGSESTLQGQINWGNANKVANTHPHYALNKPQPTKLLPSDRRAIANSSWAEMERAAGVGDCSFWSLAIETADSGYRNDPGISDFLYDHAELVARILAYEWFVVPKPLRFPTKWTDPGVVTHTHPFGVGHFTIRAGKTCPGAKKKLTVEREILPRAVQIRDAWLATVEARRNPKPIIITPPKETPVETFYFNTRPIPSPLWAVGGGRNGRYAVYVTPADWAELGHPSGVLITPAEAARYTFATPFNDGVVI